MYLPFYGFTETPFNLTPDSKFLFMSHHHQEALAAMMFGVQERKGFICLTGEIGCGKTTLCRAMLAQFDSDKIKTCIILNSYLTDLELLKAVNEEFGLDAESDSKKQLLDRLNEFLVDQFQQGNNVILIVDEAQNLRPETLEQIRMISNLETETSKLIQIMLVGQPELRRTLGLPELEQLNQRITVRYHITPLEVDEVGDYIRHRIAVAQPQVDVTFTKKAGQLIHHFSRGVPRRINVICDRCLLIGYVKGAFEIDDRMVEQAVDELRGENPNNSDVETASGGGVFGGKILGKVALAIGFAVVIGSGVYIGAWIARSQLGGGQYPTVSAPAPAPASGREVASATPLPSFPTGNREATEIAPNGPAKTPEPIPTPTPEITPKPTPTPTPTPTPKPTPKPTPALFENWQTDRDGVTRVRDPRLAEAASMINLMKRWDDIRFGVDEIKDDNIENIELYDWPVMVATPGLDFKTFETGSLSDALKLDLPVVVKLSGQDKNRSPYGLVTGMQGNVLSYIDPIHGRISLRRDQFEKQVRLARVIYKDPLGLTGVAEGSEGETVVKLQRWLRTRGLYEDELDGKFGSHTREAVQKLQQLEGLTPSGTIDPPTAMLIASDQTPGRPRLFS